MYDAPAFGEELVIQDYELDDIFEALQSSYDVGSLGPGADKAYIEDLVMYMSEEDLGLVFLLGIGIGIRLSYISILLWWKPGFRFCRDPGAELGIYAVEFSLAVGEVEYVWLWGIILGHVRVIGSTKSVS